MALAALVLIAGCAPGPSVGPSGRIAGLVSAGPTCPVVTDPPDPECADRPVAGAVIAVLDAAGNEVARVSSDAAGRFSLALVAGSYRLVPQPVEGLMGTAAEVPVTVAAGDAAEVSLAYDTGIR